MFMCGFSSNGKFCEYNAEWRGEWSDRHLYVCTAHKDYVYQCHNGDHSYDQTGIIWESGDGQMSYEPPEEVEKYNIVVE